MTDSTALTTDATLSRTVDRLESSIRDVETDLGKLRREFDQRFRDAEAQARQARDAAFQRKVNWLLATYAVAVASGITYTITHAAIT